MESHRARKLYGIEVEIYGSTVCLPLKNRHRNSVEPGFATCLLSLLSFKLGMLPICLTFAPPCSSFYGSSLFEFQTDLSAEQPTDLAWGLAVRFLKILLQACHQPETKTLSIVNVISQKRAKITRKKIFIVIKASRAEVNFLCECALAVLTYFNKTFLS